ncbi:MAG: hypothetical protein GKR89_22405 [Candidatus Latescibacteria bacterium]|nr:hypothetical protein [Candidatus Latescibacterota bacterium]
MRLGDLGLRIGGLEPGPGNALTDIAGVGVGHLAIDGDGLATGLTAIRPHLPQVERRRLYMGRYALDGGDGLTGLGVEEDFGTFSSPVVLAPAPAVGRVYEGLIRYGIERDPGLGTSTGWPPVVVGVDDTGWNSAPLAHRLIGEAELAQVLAAVGDTASEGDVGIGRGLAAFGFTGGVGMASRQVGAYTVGGLVAVNSGVVQGLAVDGYRLGVDPGPGGGAGPSTGRGSVAVVATDAPLIPGQLDRLAGRAGLGLARAGVFDAACHTGLVLAFSTQPIESPKEDDEPAETIEMVGETSLYGLFQAAFEACQEAVVNALLMAAPGRLPVLTPGAWVDEARRYQRRG